MLPMLAPVIIEKIHNACLFMEPTCDIVIMVNSLRELLAELKTIIPVRVRGQGMEVLWSGLPPIFRSHDWELWQRNIMAGNYPGAGPDPSQYLGTQLPAYEGLVKNIMEELSCTWVPTCTDATGGGFPVGVFLHVHDDGDEEVYRDIIHIAFGSFMIHFVGAKDADLLEDIMDHLYESCWLMAAFAVHIKITGDDDVDLGSSAELHLRLKNNL